ncbi:hypothetical protein [Brevibacillus laterosporus]|uniref:hypothetical protein n=2 Tax=Brevibacillus laterosporus TaxID=1465 RepID=UPI0002404B47|nr:hypothetical protein [Brevibacillus laterosporus]MBG9774200.1 hypothetical protein [Brevibacillus laterosporus]MDN9012612.1 hypothetical protein [Brevibacillus laterosporus]MDO0943700.1 hypothetical protein [Brevibacillus laterosporus]CCF14196.1 hypothetical protein BLGI_2122 [Brevibacillus laterosporus GI-9]
MDKDEKENVEERDRMAGFAAYVQKNKDKIRRATEMNTTRTKDGLVLISKNDTWRKETEWDDLYKEITKK